MRVASMLAGLLCLPSAAQAEASRPAETADALLIREDVAWPRILHDQLGLPDWLDLAIEQRTRFEWLDKPFLVRSIPHLGATSLRHLRFAAALGLVLASLAHAEEKPYLTLASTTSTNDSGLFASILPKFEAETGVQVRVVAVGTGQALEIGRRGDADALLVHDRSSEDLFLAEGHALFRRDVMYNDFVIVGPSADPAGIRGLARAGAALEQIAAKHAPFLSRGDDSGTHKAELRLWKAAGIDPSGASGGWYRETGGGMGATLNVAAELPAYTLADRATWLAFRNRRELALLVEGDASLRNPYGVLVVNPALHPHVKAELATRFADWLTGPAGRNAIESFTIEGQQPFVLLPPTETRFSPPARP